MSDFFNAYHSKIGKMAMKYVNVYHKHKGVLLYYHERCDSVDS